MEDKTITVSDLSQNLYDAIWKESEEESKICIAEFKENAKFISGGSKLEFMSRFINEPKIIFDYANRVLRRLIFGISANFDFIDKEISELRKKI